MSRFDIRTRTGLIYNIIQGAMGSSTDADAQAFFDRVTAAGGTLSATEKDAVNNLVLDLKANSLWSSMVAIYPMVGASAAACAQNLVSSSYTGTFSGGLTYASTGVTGNGTSGYMNTGLNPNSVLIQNSCHISYYSRSNQAASTHGDIGCYSNTGTVATFYTHIRYSGDDYYMLLGDNVFPAIKNYSTLGFFNGSRNSSTNITHVRNGTNLGNTTVTSTALPSLNVYISALNANGTANAFNTKECAFASIGAGLSDTQASNFYTNVQTFQTSLSRNI